MYLIVNIARMILMTLVKLPFEVPVTAVFASLFQVTNKKATTSSNYCDYNCWPAQ